MGILNLHDDVIQTHILTRLDGRSLAAAGCTSSHLQTLCSGDKLWSDICSDNFPSTTHPFVTKTINNFTSGHRTFFSDVSTSPSDQLPAATSSAPPTTTRFISAVDLKYHDKLLFSKVEVNNFDDGSEWFQTTPFRVDLLERKEVVQTGLKVFGDDRVLEMDLEKYMRLSWILIDPTRNRAVNVSSWKPVFVQRNWLTEEVELTFAIVTGGGHVSCNVEVTCGVKVGSLELVVSGVSLSVEDVDGRRLDGKGSLVILERIMVAERRWCGGGEWWREKYEEFVGRRRERKEMMEKRERGLNLVRVACGMGFLVAFWAFAPY